MKKQCNNCKHLERESRIDGHTKIISDRYWCNGFKQYIYNFEACAGWEKK